LLEPASDAAFVLVPGGGVEPPRGVNLGGFWGHGKGLRASIPDCAWVRRTRVPAVCKLRSSTWEMCHVRHVPVTTASQRNICAEPARLPWDG